MPNIKLMNMCMVIDELNNRVVVQDKINSPNWHGFTLDLYNYVSTNVAGR